MSPARRAFQRLRPAIEAGLVCAVVGLIPLPTCLVRIAFGVPCPACGMTRASLALLSGHLDEAQHFQPLIIPIVLLICGSALLAFVADEARWKRVVPVMTAVAGVALVAVWALRFLGLFGGPVPV